MISDWPTPFDLIENPELAALTLLDTALQISVRVLVAAYPQLIDQDIPYWRVDHSEAFITARSIVSRAHSLSDQISLYRNQMSHKAPPPPQNNNDLF